MDNSWLIRVAPQANFCPKGALPESLRRYMNNHEWTLISQK